MKRFLGSIFLTIALLLAYAAPGFAQESIRSSNQSLPATLNSALSIQLQGGQTVTGFNVLGLTTAGATVTIEASTDAKSPTDATKVWAAVNGYALPGGSTTGFSTINADQSFRVDSAGYTDLRLRVSTAGTGSFTIGYNSIPAASMAGASSGGSGGNVTIVQGANTAVVNASGQLSTVCANCSGSGVSQVDNTGFTYGTTVFVPMGGVFNNAITNLTSGDAGAAALTADRNLFTNTNKWAGTALGAPSNYGTSPGIVAVPGVNAFITNAPTVAQATAANLNATVVGTGTFATQAAQSGTWNITNISGTVSLPTGAATAALQPTNAAQASATSGQTGHLVQGAATTGAPTDTTGNTYPLSLTTAGGLRTDMSSVNGSTTVTAATGVQKVGIVGNAGAVFDFAGQNATSPANSLLLGGQFNTTPTTITSGNSSPLQLDNAGNLLVNIKAGAGSGGTALADQAVFTQGTTSETPMGCLFNGSYANGTTGHATIVSCTAAGSVHTTVDNTNANGQALAANSSPVVLPVLQVFGGATAAAVPANAIYNAGLAKSSEPAAATTGNLTGAMYDLTGKAVTSPYANRENMVRGSASTTAGTATTLIAAGGASVKTYVTDVECGRTDAGTAAIFVTFSDANATILVLPNNGGGGGNSKSFNVPLVTAANTALTFTASSATTTVYCSAQGFSGY